MKDEALRMALEALEGLIKKTSGQAIYSFMETERRIAMTACVGLRDALSEHPAPVQPIGYVKLIDTPFGEKLKPVLTVAVPVGSKLYTTPPAAQRQWVGLTDKQMVDAIAPLYFNRSTVEMAAKVSMDEFRAIESKLKEKNT
jgi:hypothetical protein